MSKKIWRLGLTLLLLAVFVSGCTLPWKKSAATLPASGTSALDQSATSSDSANATSTNAIQKFSDYSALQKFLADNNNPIAPNLNTFAATSSPNNTLAYSPANNQIAGVDKADILKTDGTYIYALVKNDLRIMKAVPATDAQPVSKISFADRPAGIFLDGSYLAVFGSDNQIYSQPIYKTFRRQSHYVFFKVYDLSDPANPKLARDLEFEGNYTDARLIGDYVYLITGLNDNYLPGEPLAPRVLSSGSVMSQDCSADGSCQGPDVYYFDMPYNAFNYVDIAAINLKNSDEAIKGQDYLLSDNQTIYVSGVNVYLAYTQSMDENGLAEDAARALITPQLTPDDQAKVAQIEAAPSFILSQAEKKAKATQIINSYLSSLNQTDASAWQAKISDTVNQTIAAQGSGSATTFIHKLNLANGQIQYQAMGQVSGRVLNQFSMDENGDYFRLATARDQQNSQDADSYSNIYVLDSNLQIVGRLENLATTESIYAARFFGNRAYLVTYQANDPLYVIDLSDPTNPNVLGAVKLSGASNYLQPVDVNANKFVGFGRDVETDASGQATAKGLKLSLYDFSDLRKPKEADSFLIGDSSTDSIALSDHQALYYAAANNLVVIPAVLYDKGALNFAGALVFGLANDKFSLKGRVNHLGVAAGLDNWDGVNYYDNSVKRSLDISDNLYTFSNQFLKINSLADLSELKSLNLTPGASADSAAPLAPSNSNSTNP